MIVTCSGIPSAFFVGPIRWLPTIPIAFLLSVLFGSNLLASEESATAKFLARVQAVLPVTRRADVALAEAFLLDPVLAQARGGDDGASARIASEHKAIRRTVKDVTSALGRIDRDFSTLLEKDARVLDDILQSAEATLAAITAHVDGQEALLDVSQSRFRETYIEFLGGSMDRRVVYTTSQRNSIRVHLRQSPEHSIARHVFRWKDALLIIDLAVLRVMGRHLKAGTFGQELDEAKEWRIAKDALQHALRAKADADEAVDRAIDKGPSGGDAALFDDWVKALNAVKRSRAGLNTLYQEQIELYFDDTGKTTAPSDAEMADFDRRFGAASVGYSQLEVRAVDASARFASGTKNN